MTQSCLEISFCGIQDVLIDVFCGARYAFCGTIYAFCGRKTCSAANPKGAENRIFSNPVINDVTVMSFLVKSPLELELVYNQSLSL